MKSLKSSVHKTFAVLEHFTPQKSEWGVTELAKHLGSNKSTIYRFLSDLQSLGVLYKDKKTEKYSLGLKLFELGNRVPLKSAFIDITHPILESVAANISETVHIAILKNAKVFYIDKVESPQGLKISSQIGSSNPIHCTALGKILLAYLQEDAQKNIVKDLYENDALTTFTKNTITGPRNLLKELKQIKDQSYAIDMEELEIGLICIAIPIFNQNNEPIAALSASGPANRFDSKQVPRYVNTLKKGADAIQNQIGYFKP